MPPRSVASHSSVVEKQPPSARRQLLKGDQRRKLVDAVDEDADQLNTQFQAFVETILSIYVNSWYTRLTPRDRNFIPKVNAIVFEFCRSIAGEIRRDQFTELLLIRLPTILAHHARLYNLARDQLDTSLVEAPGSDDSLKSRMAKAFHALAPHVGVSQVDLMAKEQQSDCLPGHSSPPYEVSPLYLTILVEQLLIAHLPPADSKSNLERSMIREIVARAVLGGALRRLVEPWFWWKMGLALLGEPGQRDGIQSRGGPTEEAPVFSFRAIVHGAIFGINRISALVLDATNAIKSLTQLYKESAPAAKQYQHLLDPWLLLGEEVLRISSGSRMTSVIWGMLRDGGLLTSPLAARILPPFVEARLVSSLTVARSIEKLGAILFPGGQPAPEVPDPTEEETEDLRTRLERRLLEVIPAPACYTLLGCDASSQAKTVRQILDPLSNRDINVHLVVVLLDAIVTAIQPPA